MAERKTRARSAQPAYLKTGEVLEAVGITHQVLYRYVTMGLVEEPVELADGRRVFSSRTIAAIRLIQRLNHTGYTLREIKETYFRPKRLRGLRADGADHELDAGGAP